MSKSRLHRSREPREQLLQCSACMRSSPWPSPARAIKASVSGHRGLALIGRKMREGTGLGSRRMHFWYSAQAHRHGKDVELRCRRFNSWAARWQLKERQACKAVLWRMFKAELITRVCCRRYRLSMVSHRRLLALSPFHAQS